LPELPAEARAEVERMADRLVNKILHQPIRALREAPADERPEGLLGAALRLFGLRPSTRSGRGTEEPPGSAPR
ncbi:MAG TPA: hypothetical protein VNE39_26220, partial [Planctomycetota bacterium]|nr:hypothetical protein [Planctomycetota bacterium]